MTTIILGQGKVKILPDIGKTLVDTRTNMKIDPIYCDENEAQYIKEIDL